MMKAKQDIVIYLRIDHEPVDEEKIEKSRKGESVSFKSYVNNFYKKTNKLNIKDSISKKNIMTNRKNTFYFKKGNRGR